MIKQLLIFSLLFLVSTGFPQDKKIAITIDDLPLQRIENYSNGKYQEVFDRLVKNIKSQSVPVIGFVNEKKLMTDGIYDSSKINLLKEWLDAGFDIGNHTFSHQSANQIPIEDFKIEIVGGEKVIRKLVENTCKKLEYFRHPYLHTGRSLETRNEIENFLKQKGYKSAPVTIDNAEWIFAAAYENAFDKDSAGLMKKIGEEYIKYMNAKFEFFEKETMDLFGRGIAQILLIHANRLNSNYFDELCAMMRQRGYQFEFLRNVLEDGAYQTKDTYIKGGGISWIHRWALTAGKPKEFFQGEPETPKDIMEYAGIDSE